MLAGLLTPPQNFSGYFLSNKSEIHLEWVAPPSLDLTDIVLDIYYVITLAKNETGILENITLISTEYTHTLKDFQFVTCQNLYFTLQAVNVVGMSNKTATNVSFGVGKSCNNNIIIIL